MPFPEDPIQELTVPEDAVPPDAYIYIGTNDPIMAPNYFDSAVLFHFGTLSEAFAVGIYQEFYNDGTPVEDGHFAIDGLLPDGSTYAKILYVDWYVPGGGNMYIEVGNSLAPITVSGNGIEMAPSGGEFHVFGDTRLGSHTEFPNSPYITNIDGNLQIRGQDVGLGRLFYDVQTANSNTTGSGTGAIVWILPTVTYAKNRVYRATIKTTFFLGTAGGWGAMFLRRGNGMAFSVLGEISRKAAPSAGVNYDIYSSVIFKTGNTDTTVNLAWSGLPSAGATMTLYGDPSNGAHRWTLMEDIGSVDDFEDAALIPTL